VIVNRWLVGACLALGSASALAANNEGPGFYFGASGGTAKYDIAKHDLDDAASFGLTGNNGFALNPTSSFDNTDTAWSLIGGFRINPYISIEAGYVDLGSTKYSSSSNVIFPGLGTIPTTIGIEIAAKGAVIAGSLGAPLGGGFDVHTQLGAFFAKTSLNVDVTLSGNRTRTALESDSQDLFAGVGVAYHFADGLTASVDFTRYKAVGDENETGEGDITSLRVGVHYTIPL
jgi:OOP family OmpA-OmpF porin